MEKKVCNVCNVEKHLSKYRIEKCGNYMNQCTSCESEYQKKIKIDLAPIIKEKKEKEKTEKQNQLINSYVGLTFGPFIITKYDGRYCKEKASKYPRDYFVRKCTFCGDETVLSKTKIDICRKKNITCNVCQETYNIYTKQKKCSKCNVMMDATEENFNKSKNRTFGLNYYCRKCQTNNSRKARESKEYRDKEYNQKKERRKNDLLFKLSCNVRCLIKNYIKRVKIVQTKKSSKTITILGCGFLEFKTFIENQFTDGMSWDNYGKWHLDHIIPVSLGDSEDEVIELCHHTNYCPLWAKDNLSKNNKLILDLISEDNKVRYRKYIDRYYL